MLLDTGGTGVGLVIPPEHDADTINTIRNGLATITHSARKTSGPTRGEFAILEAGLQLGQGCVVSPLPLAWIQTTL